LRLFFRVGTMPKTSIALAITLATFVGMWAYVLRVANPNIRLQAVTTGNRAGDLGDLYPRWYGTRQLLLFGRDPYGRGVSEALQLAYCGHTVAVGRTMSRDSLIPSTPACFCCRPSICCSPGSGHCNLGDGGRDRSHCSHLADVYWMPVDSLENCHAGTVGLLSPSPAVQALEMQQLGTLV
jgi:hypothetical protein